MLSLRNFYIACDIIALLLAACLVAADQLKIGPAGLIFWLATFSCIFIAANLILKLTARQAHENGDATDQSSVLEIENLQNRLVEQQKTIDGTSDRTRLLLDNIGVGILVTDGLGDIRFSGLQTSRLTGYSRSELAGKNMAALFADNALSFAHLITINCPARLLFSAKDGNNYWVDLWLSQIMLDDRSSYVISIADAGEAVKAENRRQELIAHITHELRSPLTAIYASLTMISQNDKLGAADKKSLIAICTRNAQSMKFTIDEILDFAKIESGKLTIEPRPANLQEIVNGAVESIKSLADAKSLSVLTNVAPLVVLVDTRRITQVLINLLSNGIKQSPQGKTLSISARAHEDCVELIVSDQGAGITEQAKKLLFKSFSQGGDASAIPESSSGLGLSFCAQLVGLHKGNIWVSDSEGGGAAFHFTLPLNPGL